MGLQMDVARGSVQVTSPNVPAETCSAAGALRGGFYLASRSPEPISLFRPLFVVPLRRAEPLYVNA
jgi:hypothetical protein